MRLAVSGHSGIAVFHQAYDSGAAEVAQVAGDDGAEADRWAAPFLLVDNSKLISYTNIARCRSRASAS